MINKPIRGNPKGEDCAECTNYYNDYVPPHVCAARCGKYTSTPDAELHREARSIKGGIAVVSTRYDEKKPGELFPGFKTSIQIKLFGEERVQMEKKIVQVQLSENFGRYTDKKYDYWTDDATLQVGDIVMADTRYGVALGRVAGFATASVNVNKWVIGKADLAARQERVRREARLVEVKAAMVKRRKQLEEREVYRVLALQDKEMGELYSEFIVLSSNM